MKRLLAGVLAVVFALGLLAGCGKKEQGESSKYTGALEENFLCSAHVKYGNMDVDLNLSRKGQSYYVVDIVSPDVLKGFQFSWEGDKSTISYRGLSMELGGDSLPAKALAGTLIKTLNAVLKPAGLTAKVDGGVVAISGSNDAGDYTVKLNEKDGSLISISVPGQNLEASISGFQKQ